MVLASAVIVLGACEPIGPIPGGRLDGTVAPGPVADWSFSDVYQTIQLETRPEDPHSVTVWCSTHEGRLYIPSRKPNKKRWVKYVTEDPRVRVRIGGTLYAGRAVRVTDEAEIEALVPAVLKKYDLSEPEDEDTPEVWFFRIDP